MNPMNDLRAAARSMPIPSGDVDAVIERGATLARRRRGSVAGGMAIALVVASVSYFAVTSDGSRPTHVHVGEGIANAQRGDAGIRWERSDVHSGLGFTTSLSGDSLYAVSTAPGVAANRDNPDMHPVLWHSADGVDWSPVTALGDLYLSDLADHGTRVYGVGTGPATAVVAGHKPVSPLVVGWSDNAGHDWARQSLPVDFASIAAKATNVGVGNVEVASTDRTVVAVASLIADLDVPAVLPQGVTAPNGWAITDTGVDVLDNNPECPSGTSTTAPDGRSGKTVRANHEQSGAQRMYPATCFKPDGTSVQAPPQQRGVKASYTWDQLHVGGDLLRAVRNEPFVFSAPANGTNFERVDIPALAGMNGQALLDTNGDGVLFVAQKAWDGSADRSAQPAPTLLKSSDGRTWTSVGVPSGFGYAMGIGRLGSRTALVGDGNAGATLWLSNPEGSWTATSIANAVDPAVAKGANVQVVAADVGPLGVVTVVSLARDAIADRGGVNVTLNGYTLHILNDRMAAVATDAQGKELARSDGIGQTNDASAPLHFAGDGSVVLTDPASGATLVKFPLTSVKDALNRSGSDSAPTFRVVASRDGVTWSDDSLDTLAGKKPESIGSVIVQGDRATVSMLLPQPAGSKAPQPQFALVGTPK
jgi:hypothetical protein